MPFAAIGQLALPVSNADVSQQFYGDKLGLKFLYRFGDLVFFDCAGVRLMLEGSPKEAVQSTGVCIYFQIAGIETVAAELEARGVAFEDRPHPIARMPDHELWMAFFRDPDGHLLALMEEKR